MTSTKWRPFCRGLNVLTKSIAYEIHSYSKLTLQTWNGNYLSTNHYLVTSYNIAIFINLIWINSSKHGSTKASMSNKMLTFINICFVTISWYHLAPNDTDTSVQCKACVRVSLLEGLGMGVGGFVVVPNIWVRRILLVMIVLLYIYALTSHVSRPTLPQTLSPWPSLHWINGFVQVCSIAIVNALEILQSCTKPIEIFLWPWNVVMIGPNAWANIVAH